METREESQAVVRRKNGHGTEFLLLKKNFTEGEKPVQIRLARGEVGPEETSEEAIKREIKAETGLNDVSILKEIANYEYEADGVFHKTVTFLVEADANESAGLVSVDEGNATTDNVMWVIEEEAIKLLTFSDEQQMVRLAIN